MSKKLLTDTGFQVNVQTTSSADNAADGCVVNQSIDAYTQVDPGTTITITIYHAPEVTAEPNAGKWMCNVELVQPQNYEGGPVQLELVQNIDGQNVSTVVIDGETISFPYVLNIAGADNVETGTVYLRELVDGAYVERGHYSNVPFKQQS